MRRSRIIAVCVVALAALAVVTTGANAAHGKVLLGSKRFAAPNGKGFGKPHPKTIYNGGDLSGLIKHITWHHWGSKTANGHGKNSIFKPNGGYYPKPVTIDLKAKDRGHCGGNVHPAYRKLMFREPKKPGGHKGHWRSWSGASTICKPPY